MATFVQRRRAAADQEGAEIHAPVFGYRWGSVPAEDVDCLDEATALDLVRGELSGEVAGRIRAHAARCDACRRLLAGVARVVVSSDDEPGDHALCPGDSVGPYRIVERIGAGAMGVVFVAHDPALDRRVALKLLHAGWDETGRARLRREARALARLSHPNVVTVLDVGDSDRGTYVVMELVDGPPVDQWLQSTPRSDRVLDVFLAAGQGLAAAHTHGVVHRDFKPANVLIGRDGRARVADFGLAASGPTSASAPGNHPAQSDASLTRTGTLAGTPAYMAPEQLAAGPASARSDQFAFCVSLWEGLAGRRPYAGRSVETLRDAIVRRELGAAPGMSRALRRVLARGLDPDPDQRFSDMPALLAALRRASRPGQRRKRAWLAAAGCVIAASLWARQQPAAEPDACSKAQARMADTWNDAARAEIARTYADRADVSAPTATLDDYVERWSRSLSEACAASREDLDRDRSLRCLDRQHRRVETLVQRWSTGDAQAQVGVPRVLAGLSSPSACTDPRQLRHVVPLPEQLDAAAAASALQAELDAIRVEAEIGYETRLRERIEAAADRAHDLGWAPAIAETERMRGTVLYAEGQMKEAATAFEHAYFTALEVGDLTTAHQAAIGLVLAAGIMQGRHEDGLEWIRHAETLSDRLQSPVRRSELLAIEADLRQDMGELQRAQSLLEQAIELVDDDDSNARTRTDALVGLGNVLSRRGLTTEAIPRFEQAIGAIESVGGSMHPDLVRPLTGLGAALAKDEQNERAIEILERAVAIQEAATGPDDIRVAYPLGNLALTWAGAGDHQRALGLLERAHTIFTAVFDETHPAMQQSRYNIAHQSVLLGQWDQAIEHAEAALSVFRQTGQPIPPARWGTLEMLAKAHRGRGDYDAALRAWRELVQLRNADPADHDELGWALAELGITLHQSGDSTQARARLQDALTHYAQSDDTSAVESGRVRLALADVLWDRGDREAARSQVEHARADLQTSDHPRAHERLTETRRWLQTHAPTRRQDSHLAPKAP